MKKVTFVISEVKLHEHLSVMTLSAILKNAGHATSLVYFQNDPLDKAKILKAIKMENPDFIAFSFMSCVTEHYRSLAYYIKQHTDIPIIIGGPAATFDKSLSNLKDNPFDAVCIGEGELSIVEFVNEYNRGKNLKPINNFVIQSRDGNQLIGNLLNLVDHQDQLPFPDRKMIYDKDDFLRYSKVKMFISGRGCPYKCTYCFNHKYNSMYKGKGKIVRHKSVDYFLEEIAQVKKEYPLEGIIFEDDIFIIEKEWLEEFAEKYPKRIGLPYMCYIRPNLVDRDIARLLKKSGCYSTRVAVECGNEALRNKILKRNLRNEQILKSCEILRNENLKVGTINMLGLPSETIENMKETLILNRACSPDHTSANMFMTIPGVDLTLFAIQHGMLDKNFGTSKSVHHTSEMKYPDDVKEFLYPFKALFPLMVRSKYIEYFFPILRKLPKPLLRMIDSGYRLYRNTKFYPPVSFSIREKFEALRRFISITFG